MSRAPSRACKVEPNAISAEAAMPVALESSPALNKKAPSHTPGQLCGPHFSITARAKPAAGQTGDE